MFRSTTNGYPLAIPTDFNFDPSGERVAQVSVEVRVGFLATPHSIDRTITSVDGDPTPGSHGHQVTPIKGLEVFGDIAQGSAEVIVPWTSDEQDRVIDDEYTLCAHVVFADGHHGTETCTVIVLT